MRYTVESSLSEFEFWGEASKNAEMLSLRQFDEVEARMEGMNDTWTEVEVNDFFHYNFGIIAEWLGYDSEAAMIERECHAGE